MVARGGVDRHPTRVTLLVAEFVRAGLEDLEVVVARQARPVARARDAHLVFGLRVIGLELGERQRPVEKIGAWDVAISRCGLELVVLEAEGRAGPMGRRSADRLDDPGRQMGEVLVHPPTAGGRSHVRPC